MFYKDDENVMVAEFGTGDIMIAPGFFENDTTRSAISLIDNCGECKEIGSGEEFETPVLDITLNTVIRLVFTKKESIDVFIDSLQKARSYIK